MRRKAYLGLLIGLICALAMPAASGTAAEEKNLLAGLSVSEFAPGVGNIEKGYSQLSGSVTDIGVILTDGITNKADGDGKWYVKFPDKSEQTPFVSYAFKSAQTANTLKIYAGTKDQKDKVRPEAVTLYGKETAEGTWKKIPVAAEHRKDVYENTCQILTLAFPNRTLTALRVEIAEGTGTGSGTNVSGFRLRELALSYNPDLNLPDEGGETPTPPDPPEPPEENEDEIPWEGIYDYNVNQNALFGIASERIVLSGGDAPNPSALADGKRESANGLGASKWFVEQPNGESYVEFNLEKPISVRGAVVCSGPTVGGVPDVLEQFSVQYRKNGAWVSAAEVKNNSAQLAEIAFDVVSAREFRIYTDTEVRFRVREIALLYSEVRCDVRVDSFLDMDSPNLEVKLSGALKKADSLRLILDGQEIGTWKAESAQLVIPLELSERGAHSLELLVLDSGGNLLGMSAAEFSALRVTSQMTLFQSDKAAALKAMPEDFRVLGYDTKELEALNDDGIQALTEELGVYSVDIEGMRALYRDSMQGVPMAAVNGAQTAAELMQSLVSYGEEYGISLSDLEGMADSAVTKVCEAMLAARDGRFADAAAVRSAFLGACALEAYRAAYALSLPQVFEKYRSVCEVSTAFIPKNLLSDVLFELKKMEVSAYTELPQKLAEAYAALPKQNENERPIFGGGGGIGGGGIGGGGGQSGQPAFSAEPQPVPEKKQEEPTAPIKEFVDLDGFAWAEDAIDRLREAEMLRGDGNGAFRPQDAVSRAEFAKLMVMALNLDLRNAVCQFEDVPKDAWYYGYVAAAYESGIACGDETGAFRAEDTISRQDMAVMIYRACLLRDIVFEAGGLSFADEAEIAAYAETAVGYLAAKGMIQGMEENRFAPLETATRAESAVMICRLIDVFAEEDN